MASRGIIWRLLYYGVCLRSKFLKMEIFKYIQYRLQKEWKSSNLRNGDWYIADRMLSKYGRREKNKAIKRNTH